MTAAVAPALKYPRTYHLGLSPGLHSDDKRLPSLDVFTGRRVVVTEKMDGEGTTMTRERTWPRSPDGRGHPSRDWMKAHHARKAHEIPPGWRISGEYLFARHSLAYTRAGGNALPSYFLGFGIWDERNVLLGWDDTLEMFAMLGVVPVPILYDGPFSEELPAQLAARIDPTRQEGYVIRRADRIPYPNGDGDSGRFLRAVAKYVRAGHVATDEHWMRGPVIANELIEGLSCAP
ncbi:RNA ligase family protein [Sphingosinicella sp. BN140058]|uniref:RNA ligase family protein n=1 Tax=Sphingosinicella sp. BN140058 TaxID=1892855 RepID=UPI0010137FD1|nr:RNA ligase family protein [Sphingosinicella sp. BN140058]QAY78344.1 2'-5' RNA ligase [Sphingosinicella sp. BN140058]